MTGFVLARAAGPCPEGSTRRSHFRLRDMVPVSAHATGMRSNAMRKCTFRSHVWGVVQSTSEIIRFAYGTSEADQQSAVAHLQERYFRVERKYGSPFGSGALLSDLTNVWTAAESASFDHDQAMPEMDAGDDSQLQYWNDQSDSDIAKAWEAEANAWNDVIATC
jgi:hypothetical protein